MASQEPTEEAADAASNAEQPSAAFKEPEKKTSTEVITSSPDQAQLQQDVSNDSSGTRVFRMLFRGKTLFEHRCSSQSAASSSSSSSSNLRSCSCDYNCVQPAPIGPAVLDWVMVLTSRCREEEREEGEGTVVDVAAVQPRFLMTKKITKTDLKRGDNRLLIPAGFVNSNVITFLNDEEKEAASLDDYANKKRKRETKGASVSPSKKRKPMDKGRQHGGLPVTAWTRSGWHFNALRLTCWDGSKATVLKGEHLKYLYDRSFLCDGDQVELWGFRDVHGQLHVALNKSSSSSH